tara:strand:+ start:712 stop:936 length:225 start_codon:yes stop_codon:yes gene_type:complete
MVPNFNIKEDVSNLTNILDLKAFYIEKLGDQASGLTKETMRFFCMGKELKDDLFLYSYVMHDEITIQCMKRAVP